MRLEKAAVYHRGMPITHLLYLHGFRSSPQSAKALKMAALMAERHPAVRWWCPQLPPSPQQAMALLESSIADWPARSTAVHGGRRLVAGRFLCHRAGPAPRLQGGAAEPGGRSGT